MLSCIMPPMTTPTKLIGPEASCLLCVRIVAFNKDIITLWFCIDFVIGPTTVLALGLASCQYS